MNYKNHYFVDTVILGGGLAGVWCSRQLSEKNISNIVVEKENEIGGLIRTIRYKEYKFDLGGHRIYFKDKKLENYILSLFEEDEILYHRKVSTIYYLGHNLKYPPNIFNLIKNYRVLSKILNRLENYRFLNSSNIEIKEDRNFQNYLIEKFGKLIYKLYFEEYTQKVWGIHPSELDRELGERRIGNFSFFDLILSRKSIKENANSFYYPKNGIGDLIKVLSKDVTILKNAEPLYITGDRWMVLSNNLKIKFNRLISTIPLVSLLKLVIKSRIIDSDYLKYLSYLKYRSLILVFILADKSIHFLKDSHWVYFPSKNIIFSRASNLSMWFNKNLNSYTFEIFCDVSDDLWKLNDYELVNLVCRDLKKIDKELNVIDFKVVREKYAYPLLYKGYKKYIEEIKLILPSWITICGRNGEHAYYDIEEVIGSVNKIL